MIRRWKPIQATNAKLKELVYDLHADIASEIDRIYNYQPLQAPALPEVDEKSPAWMSEKIRELFHSKMTKISNMATEKTENIEISLCLPQIVAESALKYEENNVDSTRTYDLYRYTFIEAVSLIYKRYFGKEPTITVMAPGACFFLEY